MYAHIYIYIYIYIYVIIMTTNGATLVCIKSLATRRYVQQLVQNSNTENVQALHYWPLVSPVDSHHKKPVMRRVLPCHSVIIADYMRDRFGYGLSQWETTLHCNVVSHWLSPCYIVTSSLIGWAHSHTIQTSQINSAGAVSQVFIPEHQLIVGTENAEIPLIPGTISWWRHQRETFSALLAFCAGNSPVPGEFPTQRPVTRSFDVFFDPRPNKRLSKQSWAWWFETLSCSLWRHCNDHTFTVTSCDGYSVSTLPTTRPFVQQLSHANSDFCLAHKGPLTHWGRATHICVIKLTIIGSDNGFRLTGVKPLSESMLGYLNWTLRNKLQGNFNRHSYIFIQENAFKNVVRVMTAILSQAQCVNVVMLLTTEVFPVDLINEQIRQHRFR